MWWDDVFSSQMVSPDMFEKGELGWEIKWTERGEKKEVLEKLAFIDILIISHAANMIPLYESAVNIFLRPS